jgi:hypothetical protein
MNIAGLFVVLLLSSLFILGAMKSQSGGSPAGWSSVTIANPLSLNVYSQQINELDNVDNVLKRRQYPGKPVINNLKPIDEGSQQAVLPKDSLPDIKTPVVPVGTKAVLEAKQPYFLDEALIVNYYGKSHYWDWRFPGQPLPIEFAKDPAKFVKENPEVYPSYIIKSRNYGAQLEETLSSPLSPLEDYTLTSPL